MTVLVLAQHFDAHAEALVAELCKLGVPNFRLDAEDAPCARVDFHRGRFRIALKKDAVWSDEIKSVFVRRRPSTKDFRIEELGNTSTESEYIAIQKEMLMQEFIFSLETSAVFYNEFSVSTRFMGKLCQDAVARSVGFLTPKTYVGTDHDFLVEFFDGQCLNRYCTKPLAHKELVLNGVRYTRFTEKIPKDISIGDINIDECPLIFQEYIEKEYEIRSTVIDGRVMSVKIESQMATDGTRVDWRKYNIPRTPHSNYELPKSVADRMIEFHKRTGLRFSAFDIIKSVKGDYVFVETNPFGQWLWLENLTGVPITKNIAEAISSHS